MSEDTEKFGVKTINGNKQVRVPDAALEDLDIDAGDAVGFKQCDKENTIEITKPEVDY